MMPSRERQELEELEALERDAETPAQRVTIGLIAAALVVAGFGVLALVEGDFYGRVALLWAAGAFVCFTYLGREWFKVLSHGPRRPF